MLFPEGRHNNKEDWHKAAKHMKARPMKPSFLASLLTCSFLACSFLAFPRITYQTDGLDSVAINSGSAGVQMLAYCGAETSTMLCHLLLLYIYDYDVLRMSMCRRRLGNTGLRNGCRPAQSCVAVRRVQKHAGFAHGIRIIPRCLLGTIVCHRAFLLSSLFVCMPHFAG